MPKLPFYGLTLRVLATFPQPARDLTRGIDEIRAGLWHYRQLALGALFGTAGVWVDKWLFWFSPVGESVTAGLVHAPLYDSAMFIASLVVIPALAMFVVQLETAFFDRSQSYYNTIQTHGTLQQIEASRRRLSQHTLDQLVLITVMQVGISAVLVLSAPMVVDALNLQYQQISILRYGALGAVFQFIFIASTSMLLFFDRRRLFLALGRHCSSQAVLKAVATSVRDAAPVLLLGVPLLIVMLVGLVRFFGVLTDAVGLLQPVAHGEPPAPPAAGPT